ncbi:MAG: hypothetical protein WA432_05150 [Candidatus Babeliaceae bacterium]
MNFLIPSVAILFSFLATAIMSYISMAMPIGPWIESTLVLLGALIFHGILKLSLSKRTAALGLTTVAGGIAGSSAIACAFAFPSLYFLDMPLFNTWMNSPFYFFGIMAALVIAAGSFGFLIAHIFEEKFLRDTTMTFPIGQLVAKTIAAQNQLRKAIELVGGMLSVVIFALVQIFTKKIPHTLTLLKKQAFCFLTVPSVVVTPEIIPFLIAIGFVTGHVIAIPLAVGIISKISIIDPLQQWFFKDLSSENFLIAFTSGMVVQGALMSVFDIPTIITSTFKKMRKQADNDEHSLFSLLLQAIITKQAALILLAVIILLCCAQFSIFSQIYLLLFTAICTYQLLIIAGKLGIAPLGRFATFVLLPGLLFFGYNNIQIMLVSTFVELCGIVAVNCLFGRKMAQLTHIERAQIVLYQWIGLLVSALSIGIIFWLLIKHFGLGSAELCAQKAYLRALLVQSYNFNYIVIVLGGLFGFMLKYIKVNPMLVLGGLLMRNDYSLLLILGGFGSYIVRDKEAYYPFWSGVFAASSLYMIIKALMRW